MPQTAYYAATSAVDISAVSSSFTQTLLDQYAWTQLPQARVLDKRAGRSNVTTYELPDFSNFMLEGNLLASWEFGDALPADRYLGTSTVTVTVNGVSTPFGISRPSRRDVTHRLADLESNIVPGLLSVLYAGIEKSLVSHLTNASTFDSKTWTGSNELDDYASDREPIGDLIQSLGPMRAFQGMPGMEIWMIADARVLTILGAYDDFSGGGVGSGLSRAMGGDFVKQRIMDGLGIDKVVTTSAVINDNKLGQTDEIVLASDGFLGCYCVDTRTMSADMTTEGSYDAIDGAAAVFLSRTPEVVAGMDTLAEVERFYGRAGYQVKGPRTTVGSTKLGFFYPGSENLSSGLAT